LALAVLAELDLLLRVLLATIQYLAPSLLLAVAVVEVTVQLAD
jgi:hypothetical protein